MDIAALEYSLLFAGLDRSELDGVAARMRLRSFEPGEALCEAGAASDCLWVITKGLVHVLAASPGASRATVDRQRKGDAVGEVGALLGEPRLSTVVASVATTALELQAPDFVELVREHPRILLNMVRTARDRLRRERSRSAHRERGETVGLAVGASLGDVVPALVNAASSASPRPVTALDRRYSFAGAVTVAEDLVATSTGTVLLPIDLEPATVAAMVREADRVIAFAGTEREAAVFGAMATGPFALTGNVEAILVGDAAIRASRAWPSSLPVRVLRTCERHDDFPLSAHDVCWLGRHVTRTKLGLALGAGGAKGYAHVGALQVLAEAGYSTDFVAGSSIGAIVGAYLALGMDAPTIESTMRQAFDEATVAEIFSRPSLGGASKGVDVMSRIFRETTAERSFEDIVIPLTVMAVDLTERGPAPLRSGSLWQALLAATALAGVFPPFEQDGHRLVDGLALVPVPTGSLLEDGADITVSVNLMSADTLPTWPDGEVTEPAKRRWRPGLLDVLLDVMDLSQLDTSVRHAGLADVVITPRFGPSHWRDFQMADRFVAAGRAAAEAQLPNLRSLVLPAAAVIDTRQ